MDTDGAPRQQPDNDRLMPNVSSALQAATGILMLVGSWIPFLFATCFNAGGMVFCTGQFGLSDALALAAGVGWIGLAFRLLAEAARLRVTTAHLVLPALLAAGAWWLYLAA